MKRCYLIIGLSWLNVMSGALAYVPPKGIPDPGDTWGGLHPIDASNPVPSTVAPRWFETPPRVNSMAGGDVHDCYYIDNSSPTSTDAANPFGTPAQPRKTIPNIAYAAGSYIEIHGDGGTGTFQYSGTFNPRGRGTAMSPIWFVGVNKPILGGRMDMGAADNPGAVSYLIFDGLYWRNGGKPEIRPRFTNNAIDHIVIRRCVIEGTGVKGEGTGLAVGTSSVGDPTQTTRDVVVYNCDISNFGDKNDPSEECGVYPKMYVTRFWVLESDIHDVAEDGCGGAHGGKRTSSGYYIGRCRIHDNLTNGIDLKGIRDIVISENAIYNHYDVWVNGVHKSSGIGQAVTFHYGGPSSGPDSIRNYPEEVTLCFNTIYNSRFGLRTSRCGTLRVIGNVIYNMHAQPSDYTSTTEAIQIGGLLGDTWIANNTIHGCDGGINVVSNPGIYNGSSTYFAGYTVSYSGKTYVCINEAGGAGITGIAPTDAAYWKAVRLQVWGNIISGRTQPGQSEIEFAGPELPNNSVDMDYNIFHNARWGEAIFYGNTMARSLVWLRANTIHGQHSVNFDPRFVNPSAGDFSLQMRSPAIAASTEGTAISAYGSFNATFDVPVNFDRAGNARPADLWSMGAYEYVGIRAPRRPQGLKISSPVQP